jgi:integrase/recombinase XerD
MAMKLSTTLSHITTVPNSNNSKVISEFYHYMKSIGTSENYQNQNLKAIIVYAKFLDPEITFYDIQKREQIVTFLDTKIYKEDNLQRIFLLCGVLLHYSLNILIQFK